MAKREEKYLSSGDAIARGLELIEKHNPEIMERYRRNMRAIYGIGPDWVLSYCAMTVCTGKEDFWAPPVGHCPRCGGPAFPVRKRNNPGE